MEKNLFPIGSVYFGNAVSLKYTLPMGAHDLGGSEDICIRLARPGDSFLPFGGSARQRRSGLRCWRSGAHAPLDMAAERAREDNCRIVGHLLLH